MRRAWADAEEATGEGGPGSTGAARPGPCSAPGVMLTGPRRREATKQAGPGARGAGVESLCHSQGNHLRSPFGPMTPCTVSAPPSHALMQIYVDPC